MHFLGEYYRKTNVYVELVTKNRHGILSSPDQTPTALVECIGPTGIAFQEPITLSPLSTGRYYGVFRIPDQALYGDYIITYHALFQGINLQTQERFRVSELFRLIENTHNTSNALQIDIGNPSVEQTNLHLLLKQLVTQHLPYDKKIKVTNYTLKTDDGLNTTVILNGSPAKNVIVNVMSPNPPFDLMGKTSTNDKGEWSIELTPGYYRFDFVHPNGVLLKTIKKQVN